MPLVLIRRNYVAPGGSAPVWSGSQAITATVGDTTVHDLAALCTGSGITYSLQAGTLPAGRTLGASSITGTYSAAASGGYTIRATNAGGFTDRVFSWTVAAASEWPGTVPDLTGTIGTPTTYNFDALDPPTSVDTILGPSSLALPSGWTLNGSGKQLEFSGTGVEGVVSTVQLRSVDPGGGTESPASLAEWNAIKGAAGVTKAIRFDTDSEVTGAHPEYTSGDTNFWENSLYDANGSYGGDGLIYRLPTGGIAGGPAMRVTHPGALGAQAGGWRSMFVDGRNQLPLGTPQYVSYAVRNPAIRFTVSGINAGWKTAILAGWGSSGWGNTCQGAELTITNAYEYGIVRHYTSCSPGLSTDDFPTSGDIQYQNVRDRGAGYPNKFDRYCLYSQWNTGSCVRLQADVWMRMKYKITRDAAETAHIEIWVQFEGSSAWTKVEDYANYPNWASDPFNTLTLTSYTTGRAASEAGRPSLYFDATEVVFSSQDIAPRTVWV